MTLIEALLLFLYTMVYIPTSFAYMLFSIHQNGSFYPITPKYLYRAFRLNWFGAIVLYILSIIINPFWWISSLIYVIFTITFKRGNKDD